MSGIGDTFRGINRRFGSDTDERLSLEPGGQLCLYKGPPGDGSGQIDLEDLQQKFQRGSQHVVDLLDKQFGQDVRLQVLQKITTDTGGRDVTKEMTGGDLPKIGSELRGRTPLKQELDSNQRLQMQVFLTGGLGAVVKQGRTDEVLDEIFGERLTDDQIRGLGGIPDRCQVEVEVVDLDPEKHFSEGRGVQIKIPEGSDRDFKEIQVTVYKDSEGHRHIYRDSTELQGSKTDRPDYLGSCVLLKQVDTGRSLGVQTIHNMSVRQNFYNGYYTWARYGGNAPLSDDKINYYSYNNSGTLDRRMTNLGGDKAPKEVEDFREAIANPEWTFSQLKNYERRTHVDLRLISQDQFVTEMLKLQGKTDLDIQDLMATPEGRALWRVFGFSVPLEYRLDTLDTVRSFQEYTLPNSCFDPR